MFALWATGTGINDLISSPSQLQRHTSATLPSGYAPGFLSISITIRFTSWENFGSGSRSFGRCPGSYGAVRVRNVAFGSHAHTSKTLPSIFSCHAGIPWPVSKLWAGSPVSGCCHTWPETVWLRNILSVRGTYSRKSVKI